MGECLIQKNGVTIDSSLITAVEADVLEGKTFLKQDGSKGVGTLPNRKSPSYTLSLNGELSLPAGYYQGGTVKQSVPVFYGQTVTVGKNAVTVDTSDKYAAGNINVLPIKNLTPAVIRKGKYVGGVGPGTWQGYINDNPDRPFYLGTFGPGWAASSFIYKAGSSNQKGSAGVHRNAYYMYCEGSGYSVASVLSKKIDFSKYKKIIFDIEDISPEGAGLNENLQVNIYQNYIESYMEDGSGINPLLGNKLYGGTLNIDGINEKDLSAVTGVGYIYIYLWAHVNREIEWNIYEIRLE